MHSLACCGVQHKHTRLIVRLCVCLLRSLSLSSVLCSHKPKRVKCARNSSFFFFFFLFAFCYNLKWIINRQQVRKRTHKVQRLFSKITWVLWAKHKQQQQQQNLLFSSKFLLFLSVAWLRDTRRKDKRGGGHRWDNERQKEREKNEKQK